MRAELSQGPIIESSLIQNNNTKKHADKDKQTKKKTATSINVIEG
jgi:hypothetical protein